MEINEMRQASSLLNELVKLDSLIRTLERGALMYFAVGTVSESGAPHEPYKLKRGFEIGVSLLKEDRAKIADQLKKLGVEA